MQRNLRSHLPFLISHFNASNPTPPGIVFTVPWALGLWCPAEEFYLRSRNRFLMWWLCPELEAMDQNAISMPITAHGMERCVNCCSHSWRHQHKICAIHQAPIKHRGRLGHDAIGTRLQLEHDQQCVIFRWWAWIRTIRPRIGSPISSINIQ